MFFKAFEEVQQSVIFAISSISTAMDRLAGRMAKAKDVVTKVPATARAAATMQKLSEMVLPRFSTTMPTPLKVIEFVKRYTMSGELAP